jgi:hypothetical protein
MGLAKGLEQSRRRDIGVTMQLRFSNIEARKSLKKSLGGSLTKQSKTANSRDNQLQLAAKDD